ncbi:MAG: MGMT family protein, partial [Planctomycetota bacterium]|nr:MGMT family protein [Planctomycetota bacterium]
MLPFFIDVPDLIAALVDLVRQVPRGRVATYGELAKALGDAKAAIWVAGVLNDPPPAIWEVAHRIMKANGEPGRFPADALARLVGDGVPVRDGRADVMSARFRDFETAQPLELLKR